MPLSQGRTKASHFNKLVEKVRNMVDGWSYKLLSQGRKMVVFVNALCSLPVYILSAYGIPIKVIKTLENMFSIFLWGSYQGRKKGENFGP